jgi:thiol:disulfide interchange protein
MYASMKREEDLCFELIAQLERKKCKASDLQAEWKQVDTDLQEIEERDWDEEHKRELEAVDGSCEEIWEALEKTKKQIAEAQADLSAREAKAQEQSEEAEALKTKLAQYPAKSALSGVLSQALFALLLGLVLSLLLPKVSHSFEISSF